MLNQDSGKRYYMIPAVIIAISMLAGIVMGTLHIGFVPGTLAFGLQVAAYTIVSLAVFILFSLVWIGSE